MKVLRTSMVTNRIHTMDIDVTEDQLHEWQSGKLIQHVMPHLTPTEREFLMTGITPEEWEETMGEA